VALTKDHPEVTDNRTPTAPRLRLAPFGFGPSAHPVACETLSGITVRE